MCVAAFLVVVMAAAATADSEEVPDVVFRYVLVRIDCERNLKFECGMISNDLAD